MWMICNQSNKQNIIFFLFWFNCFTLFSCIEITEFFMVRFELNNKVKRLRSNQMHYKNVSKFFLRHFNDGFFIQYNRNQRVIQRLLRSHFLALSSFVLRI